MKLHEAIQHVMDQSIPGEHWFRPVSWKGIKKAYALNTMRFPTSSNAHMTLEVPSPRGGNPGMTFYAEDLAGDWEILSPDVVLKGE